jgi:hypothetical protein
MAATKDFTVSWIKITTNLTTKPAVSAIGMQTHEAPHAVVGRLLMVWCWADPLTVDGFVAHADAKLIDRVAGKRGFAAAMGAVDWLALEDGGVRFPNWERHNSRSAKARAGEAERKRMQRADTPAHGSPEECPDNKPDNVSTRGEERRIYTPKAPMGAGGEPSGEPEPIRQTYPGALAQSPEFIRCWEGEWLPYIVARNRGRTPPIQTLEGHLRTCLKLGAAKAVGGLKSAIDKNWAAPDVDAKVAQFQVVRPWEEAPEDWKAYWRETYPPEDFPDAPRYEDGKWSEVRTDHKKQIYEGLRKRHRQSA